jgi:hypothetical protein
MKTIAGLKAELDNAEIAYHQTYDDFWYGKALGMKFVMQSLSQKIDGDVGKCEEEVRDYSEDAGTINHPLITKCKSVPEPQKCEGCKRLLKFKGEIDVWQ